MLQFPSNPSQGQYYTSSVRSWIYSGTQWVLLDDPWLDADTLSGRMASSFANATDLTYVSGLITGYVGSNTGYVRLNSSTNTGYLWVDGLAAGSTSSSIGLSLYSPVGGNYSYQSSVISGAIRIELPFTGMACMMRGTIRVFNYLSNSSFDVLFGGYTYPVQTGWFNTSAVTIGRDHNKPIRFSHSGQYYTIYIGDSTGVWSYPKVSIEHIHLGHTINAAEAVKPWSISITTGGYDTVSNTITSPAFNLTYEGNTIWNAGNDGAGSTLDADLLDGQQGSYYSNTGAIGVLSGNYNYLSGLYNTHQASTTAHGISSFGATLVDDTSASAARVTLGANDASNLNAGIVSASIISGGVGYYTMDPIMPGYGVRYSLSSPTIGQVAADSEDFLDNRLRYQPPYAVEVSINSGSTFSSFTGGNYGVSLMKILTRGTVDGNNGFSIYSGSHTSTGTITDIRFRWSAYSASGWTNSYVYFNDFFSYVGTNGNSFNRFQIEAKDYATQNWATFVDYNSTLAQWPGYLWASHAAIPFLNSATRNDEVRVTFSTTWNTTTFPNNPVVFYGFKWFGTYGPSAKRSLNIKDADYNMEMPYATGLTLSGRHVVVANGSTWDISVTGSAGKLITPRTIAITGDVVGNTTFDGSSNISLSSTILPATIFNTFTGVSTLYFKDTRSLNPSPTGYPSYRLQTDFKQSSAINSPSNYATYGGLITLRPWLDDSGGKTYQMFFGTSTNAATGYPRISVRDSMTGDGLWSNWYELLHTRTPAFADHTGDTSTHFTEASINHNNIQNIGSNTHAQIDTHLASTSNPHSVTAAQVGAASTGNYSYLSGAYTTHAADSTIHYTQGSISITSSQVSDFTEAVQDTIGSPSFLLSSNGVTGIYNDTANTLTLSGINATTTTRGVASFNSTYFTVSNGAVSLGTVPLASIEKIPDLIS